MIFFYGVMTAVQYLSKVIFLKHIFMLLKLFSQYKFYYRKFQCIFSITSADVIRRHCQPICPIQHQKKSFKMSKWIKIQNLNQTETNLKTWYNFFGVNNYCSYCNTNKKHIKHFGIQQQENIQKQLSLNVLPSSHKPQTISSCRTCAERVKMVNAERWKYITLHIIKCFKFWPLWSIPGCVPKY